MLFSYRVSETPVKLHFWPCSAACADVLRLFPCQRMNLKRSPCLSLSEAGFSAQFHMLCWNSLKYTSYTLSPMNFSTRVRAIAKCGVTVSLFFLLLGMRGDSYLFGMRGLGHYGCIPEDGGQFLLYSINGDSDLKRCFTEEDFHEIIDFNDLPNSLFACNVHQSVFESVDSKVQCQFPSFQCKRSIWLVRCLCLLQFWGTSSTSVCCIQSSFAWVFFLRWATTFKSLKAFLPTMVNVGFFSVVQVCRVLKCGYVSL